MQVAIDFVVALAPLNLECCKADAFFFGALLRTFTVTSHIIRFAFFVFWSFVKLENFRIVFTEDEWNTEIV